MADNNRILIVDDEPEIRRGYRSFLNPEAIPSLASSRTAPGGRPGEPQPRFELLEAGSGEKALELLLSELAAGRRFAGAFVDVRMPGKLDGLEFIREAWKADPGLLVVVATAYQDRSVDEIGRVFGAQYQDQWDYLNKPFTRGEIVQKARQLVSSWNRRDREKAYLAQIREQQHALVAQERLAALGRLARSVGHEFGNILQPIITKLELARRRIESGQAPTSVPLLEEVVEAAELGSSICRDLLVFGREGFESAEPSALESRAPVERALRLLRHELSRKHIHVQLDLPEGRLVRGREPRLIQVFLNLFSNALDAMPDGGHLAVSSGVAADGFLEIRVRDDGQGIAPDALGLVFQPLFTTKGSRGNGIGLAVCKQIVEEHGGRVTLESEPGRGTTATVALPRAHEGSTP